MTTQIHQGTRAPMDFGSVSRTSGGHDVSNEQNPGCLGLLGDEILPTYVRDYFIKPFFRIHIKQPL